MRVDEVGILRHDHALIGIGPRGYLGVRCLEAPWQRRNMDRIVPLRLKVASKAARQMGVDQELHLVKGTTYWPAACAAANSKDASKSSRSSSG